MSIASVISQYKSLWIFHVSKASHLSLTPSSRRLKSFWQGEIGTRYLQLKSFRKMAFQGTMTWIKNPLYTSNQICHVWWNIPWHLWSGLKNILSVPCPCYCFSFQQNPFLQQNQQPFTDLWNWKLTAPTKAVYMGRLWHHRWNHSLEHCLSKRA